MSDISLGANYVNQKLAGLSNFSKPKALSDPKVVEEKFETFQKDLDRITDLKGANIPAAGFFPSQIDTAPRNSGDVNVSNVGSLHQTSQGCVVQVLRHGLWGSVAGYVTYDFDNNQNTVKATEVEHELASGLLYRPAGTTTYTLDLNEHKVFDYQQQPGEPGLADWKVAGTGTAGS